MRLILHFDINKTILMRDPASKVSVSSILPYLISECAWGTINETSGEWELIQPPILSYDKHETFPVTAITFNEYLENQISIARIDRKILKSTFVDEGSIGYCFLDQLQYYKSYLSFHPSFINDVPKYCKDGNYHIVPAFFSTINYLLEENIDFKIIFRTFGIDGSNVIDEYNLFCENKHPLFPCNKGNALDRRIRLPIDTGKFIRMGVRNEDTYLSCIDEDKSMVDVLKGGKEAYEKSILGPNKSMFLQDDFTFWNNNCESDQCGKIYLIDQNKSNVIQIFFDDNIERDRAHIVDVRDISTFTPIDFSVAKNKFIFRVEPLKVIAEDNYFIKIIEALIKSS